MNWRRGFFRIWIICSITWCVAVLLIAWPDRVEWPWSPPLVIHVRMPDNAMLDYPFQWGIDHIKTDLQKQMNVHPGPQFDPKTDPFCIVRDAPGCDPKTPWPVPTDWEQQFSNPPLPIMTAFKNLSFVAAVPSLLLLLFGSIVGWTIKGFKRA